jgi:hypothetical protein
MRATASSSAARFLRSQHSGSAPDQPPPDAPLERSIRNIAYALLSGADGWMFDGEDALGQIDTMALANQRNLKLALHRDPLFMKVAEDVAGEMNRWAQSFLGRQTIKDWKAQLDFTTEMFRPRGLHLQDRHPARRRPGLFGLDRRYGALHREQSRRPRTHAFVDRVVPAEDPNSRGSRALGGYLRCP